MLNKYKAAGLGFLLISSSVFGSLYYLLSYTQSDVFPELKEEYREEEIVVTPQETIEDEKVESVPRAMPAPDLSEIKTTTPDEGLFEGVRSSSVVYEFKSYLIGSKDSNAPWGPKLEIWKENIKQNKKLNPFTWKHKEDPNFKNIKDRCENAYKRESWTFESFLKQEERRKQYWGLVWTMCAQAGKDAPSNWGG